jgi:hypothetical protein
MLPGSWSSIGASQVDLAVQYLENKVTVTANTLHRNSKQLFPEMKLAASLPIPTFMYLLAIFSYTFS